MAGFTVGNTNALIRSQLWSTELKDILLDQLLAEKYVRWLDNFPDGNTLNIPSIGQMDAKDYQEDQAIEYTALDTGNFQFTINNYVSSATYITNKAKQDLYYASELISQFVPKESRAMKERLEKDIFKTGQPTAAGTAGWQTAGSLNTINTAAHRWVGQGTLNSKNVLSIQDFAGALYSLKKANVPQENLLAIVDPSTEYVLNTLTNLVNVQNNPKWEGIIDTGIAKNMTFVKNIYGFDVYCSNRLPLCGNDQSGASETINGTASGANCVGNLFFSASSDVLPYVGAWRQMPKVDGEYNKDFQREEYITTSRYGLSLFRPENFITVLSDPSAVGSF